MVQKMGALFWDDRPWEIEWWVRAVVSDGSGPRFRNRLELRTQQTGNL